MKKIIFSLVVLSLLIQVPVFAEETKQEAMSAMLINQPAEASVPSIARTSGFQPSQIVATSDGGLFLLLGLRLMKYDADLNLVKQTRVPTRRLSTSDTPTPAAGTTDQPAAAGLQEEVV